MSGTRQLTLHFLNVGHGDCTFIDFPSGRLTMIDVNNTKSLPDEDEIALAANRGLSLPAFKSAAPGKLSWEAYYKSLLVDPYDFYTSHFAGRSIFRYLQTHPDMDHMSGLCRFFWQEEVELENFWDTQHERDREEATFDKGRYDWNDWLVYELLRNGKRKGNRTHRVLHNHLGSVSNYWTDDGITVLSPTTDLDGYCNAQENWNNISYILRVDFGGRSVVFPGDAEKPAWDSIQANLGADALSCDILKAAHHGRMTGYSESAVEDMDPSIVLCSVGKKPDTDASDEYRDHGAAVLSTRYNGTITTTILENGKVTVTDRKGDVIASLPALG